MARRQSCSRLCSTWTSMSRSDNRPTYPPRHESRYASTMSGRSSSVAGRTKSATRTLCPSCARWNSRDRVTTLAFMPTVDPRLLAPSTRPRRSQAAGGSRVTERSERPAEAPPSKPRLVRPRGSRRCRRPSTPHHQTGRRPLLRHGQAPAAGQCRPGTPAVPTRVVVRDALSGDSALQVVPVELGAPIHSHTMPVKGERHERAYDQDRPAPHASQIARYALGWASHHPVITPADMGHVTRGRLGRLELRRAVVRGWCRCEGRTTSHRARAGVAWRHRPSSFPAALAIEEHLERAIETHVEHPHPPHRRCVGGA